MRYNINFDKLVVLLLPTFLRKPRIIAFLTLFSGELTKLYDFWLFRKKEDEKWLNHNSQVCYLRKILNDNYDPIDRRIIITDGQLHERQYIYTFDEKRPKKLGVMYLRQASDYADSGYDFFVVVPKDIYNKKKYGLEASINRYKLASKRHKVIYNE